MKNKEVEKFMKSIKLYFEPISSLINFDGIESYLYSELIGDTEDDDPTMDFILTLIDFMLKSQLKNKKETIELYDMIDDYEKSRIKEIELTEQIIKKRIQELKENEK